VNPIKVFISAVALLLLGFVAAGLLMEGAWTAERSTELDAPPAAVFPWVNRVEGWDAWTPWDAVEDTISGPPAGVGATRRWNDPQWGQGEWTLTASEPDRRIVYRVGVDDGDLSTTGEIVLEPLPDGRTRLTWTEQGDFGWNPLLAWMARGMDRMQGREMEKNLAALRALLDTLGSRPPEGG
jgi:hypothetical protein